MTKHKERERQSGVLLPVSSLFGSYGIGNFGKEARLFVDWMKRAGLKNWSLLPLNPTGYGNSPYQSFSAFAGNLYYIDPEQLMEEGLLTRQELMCAAEPSGQTDYGKLFVDRPKLLCKAYGRFQSGGGTKQKEYLDFCRKNRGWLNDYAAYMTIKEEMDYLPWHRWPEALANRKEPILSAYLDERREKVNFWKFTQFVFFQQWERLHAYAGRNGIRMIGDMPFYIAQDSADVWCHRELFAVDPQSGEITMWAGVPADEFSRGDRSWGNPVYRWENHERDGYRWFCQRIRLCARMYDGLRIDHVLAIMRYYGIRKEGERGAWYDGPDQEQYRFSAAIQREAAKTGIEIIAEDLGPVPPGLRERLYDIGWLRMRVLQFAFTGKYKAKSDHLPFYYDRDMVVYTGTHDNPTLKAFLESKTDQELDYMKWWTGKRGREALRWALIGEAYKSVADHVIIPLQDFLGLGDEARVCFPEDYNRSWKWRLEDSSMLDEGLARRIKKLAVLTGRY